MLSPLPPRTGNPAIVDGRSLNQEQMASFDTKLLLRRFQHLLRRRGELGHAGRAERRSAHGSLSMAARLPGTMGSKPRCQRGHDDVVDVRVRKAVRAAVVLEGGDDPALGFDRRERRDSCVL